MVKSLNCLFLGKTSFEDIFVINVADYNKINDVYIDINLLKISDLKFLIWNKKKDTLGINDPDDMKLWRVNIAESEQDRLKEFEKDNIVGAKLLLPNFFFKKWFIDQSLVDENIHIIVQVPIITTAITDQEYVDIRRIIKNLGYLPRLGGFGGTSLYKDEKNIYTAEGISLTDPDISQRPKLVSDLAKSLEEKKVILIRAPPYSGKTSLAQLLENYYLVNSSKQYRVIRLSLLWGQAVGILCEYDNFGIIWEKIVGIEWNKWLEQCKKITSILIIDEVQMIYKDNKEIDISMENTGTAAEFWNVIKLCLQGPIKLNIIMFAAYGYGSNSGGLSTPVSIPLYNSMDLNEIKFSNKEIETYTQIYCNMNFDLSINDISQFIRYIKDATAGHVGLVRHILQHTKDAMKSRIRKEKLTWKIIFKYLNSHSFNGTIDNCRAAPKLSELSETQKQRCQEVYLNRSIIFMDDDDNKYLIKSGIFVSDIINDVNCLHFAAPLIERSFFQQYYGREIRANSTPGSLYEFIVKTFTIICSESNEILKYSLGYGTDNKILEQTWQKEFYRIGTRVLGNSYFLSCNVGAPFEIEGYIDFYIDGLDWAIELLREGLDMEKHRRRFNNRYKRIADVANEIVIVDIRSESKKVRKLKKGFIHISYSNNYDTYIIECLDKKTIEIKIDTHKN